MRTLNIRSGASFAALVISMCSVAAHAQDTNDPTNQETPIQAGTADDVSADEGQGIVVTGSRIVRRELESAAPVAVVQDEEFKLSGTVNAEQVLNTLPQVVPGTTAASNNPGGGVATLDLRGLGEARNLVLVNGRRWMFFDTTQIVDLNTIPTFLIDSVDVVTGGASAVYGSDAIAGVTNFRLRNIDGAEFGGQYNITERGDGRRFEVFGALGTSLDDGRGHATVFAEYYQRRPIFQGDRDFSSVVLTDDGAGGFSPGGSSTLPQGVLRYQNGTAAQRAVILAGTDFAANGAVVFDAPGAFRPRAGDLYNFGPANYLQVPQERYLLGGYGDYEIADGHTAYAEVSFVNNRLANELAATPVTGTFRTNLAAIQPFLTATDFAQLQTIDTREGATNDPGFVNLFVQRRVTETGSRNSLDERNAFRVLGGIRGPVTEAINYDAYYMYARTRNSNVQAGNISRSAFAAGLDGSAPAINIFGPNTLTPTMVDQISILAQNGEVSELQVANAAISGSLFNFGTGADDVGFALGGEYRKLSSQFIPDTALSSGDVIGFNAGQATAGSYDVREAFAELRIPIFRDRPGLHKLELTGAARYSDYSLANVGGVWTYAVGAEYAPIKDITFRGQYQRAVRAPNVFELYSGQNTGFPAAQDPCALASAATNPAIRDLCIATGVPAGSVGTPAVQINTQIQANFGGNPNLEEEVSDSYTAGVVLRPSFLPGFAATIDYYNIEVRGAIDVFGGGLNNTLNLCYNVFQDISSPYCQVLAGRRNAAGIFDDANPPLLLNANTGKLETEGVDLQVSYGTRLPFRFVGDDDARLSFFFLGTYTRKFDLTPVADAPQFVNECAGRFGVLACLEPKPKYKWSSRLSYIDGPLTLSGRWRHLSSVRDDDDQTDYSTEVIPSYDIFDLALSFDVTSTFSLSMGVNNLLDKTPFPVGDNQSQTNTYPSSYDVIGRDFFVSTRLTF